MNKKITEILNSLLKFELIGIRQYLINGIKLRFDGYSMLANKFLEEAHESGEGAHVEILGNRILMLGGKIDCDAIEIGCQIGSNLKDILTYSLNLEIDAIKNYQQAIKEINEFDDFATTDILTSILKEEEEHKRWLEMQINLLETMGLSNYIQYISK
jgi:bacterioferritin